MMPLSDYLDGLKADAERANVAEDAFRRSIVARTKELERERAFAFRRLNLMRAVAEAIASAESEEIAVAGSAAVLRGRLGWSSDSDARSEVISQFAPVAQSMYAQLAPEEPEEESADAPKPDVTMALGAFETWYAATHPVAFWVLFENVMPETPVVDF
jgi:hypothetical protein